MGEIMARWQDGLPNKAKINHLDYKIRWMTPAEFEACGNDGECDHSAGVISLNPGMSRQQTAETLWHEIKHAIWHAFAFKPSRSEERVVRAHAQFESGFMRDNPEIMRWIVRSLTGRAKR
jgi:hypothetical protein